MISQTFINALPTHPQSCLTIRWSFDIFSSTLNNHPMMTSFRTFTLSIASKILIMYGSFNGAIGKIQFFLTGKSNCDNPFHPLKPVPKSTIGIILCPVFGVQIIWARGIHGWVLCLLFIVFVSPFFTIESKKQHYRRKVQGCYVMLAQ